MPKNFDVPYHEGLPKEISREDAMAELLTPEEWGCVRASLREMLKVILGQKAKMEQDRAFLTNLRYEIDMIETVLEKTKPNEALRT